MINLFNKGGILKKERKPIFGQKTLYSLSYPYFLYPHSISLLSLVS